MAALFSAAVLLTLIIVMLTVDFEVSEYVAFLFAAVCTAGFGAVLWYDLYTSWDKIDDNDDDF